MSEGTAEATAARLGADIAAGRWEDGARLPAERALAAEMGVSRATLRKALAALERRGRIRRHVGQGTFVTAPTTEEVTATLRLSPPPSPADVLELRRMIEPAIAAAAALRATAPELRRFSAIVEDGAEAAGWEAWEEADSRFHTQLAVACRNPLLTGVLETLNVIRAQAEWTSLRRGTLTRAAQRAYAAQHRALVDALAARDPAVAATAMRDHLDAVRAAMIGGAADAATFVPDA